MNQNKYDNRNQAIRDCGPEPFIVNMDSVAKMNPNYRTALWTGEYLQVTLMSIPVGGNIGEKMLQIGQSLWQNSLVYASIA